MKLKNLILNKLDVSISQFCKDINISRRTIYNILEDKHEPNIVTIRKICHYFKEDANKYID